MYKLIILPATKKDIKDSANWYNLKQKGLGKKLTFQARRKIKSIKQNPSGYAIRYDIFRTAVLDVFPFMVHYYIDDRNGAVVISAFLHTSRNPDIWPL